MNCKELEPLIYLHAEGELSEQEQQQVKLHLETCEGCRKLYSSLKQMRTLTMGLERIPESLPTADSVIRQLEKERKPARSMYILPVMRMAAASVLLFLACTLAYQEVQFSRRLTALEQRMNRNADSDNGSGENECLQRLKRKLHSPAFSGNYQAFNTLSDEEINGYLRQVCGTSVRNAGALKEILQDAGVDQQ